MEWIKEIPGAKTPWTAINQLLRPDENFEVENTTSKGWLLAPKEESKFAALLFF